MPARRASLGATISHMDEKWDLLDKAMDAAQDEARLEFAQLHAIPTTPLYHDTDASGLKGVLEERKIRATHSYFLNDRTEILYACEVIDACVKRTLPRIADPLLAEHLSLLPRGMREVSPREVYLACFSEDGDRLSQWRTYAAAGHGSAIPLGATAFWSPAPWCRRVRARQTFQRAGTGSPRGWRSSPDPKVSSSVSARRLAVGT